MRARFINSLLSSVHFGKHTHTHTVCVRLGNPYKLIQKRGNHPDGVWTKMFESYRFFKNDCVVFKNQRELLNRLKFDKKFWSFCARHCSWKTHNDSRILVWPFSIEKHFYWYWALFSVPGPPPGHTPLWCLVRWPVRWPRSSKCGKFRQRSH